MADQGLTWEQAFTQTQGTTQITRIGSPNRHVSRESGERVIPASRSNEDGGGSSGFEHDPTRPRNLSTFVFDKPGQEPGQKGKIQESYRVDLSRAPKGLLSTISSLPSDERVAKLRELCIYLTNNQTVSPPAPAAASPAVVPVAVHDFSTPEPTNPQGIVDLVMQELMRRLPAMTAPQTLPLSPIAQLPVPLQLAQPAPAVPVVESVTAVFDFGEQGQFEAQFIDVLVEDQKTIPGPMGGVCPGFFVFISDKNSTTNRYRPPKRLTGSPITVAIAGNSARVYNPGLEYVVGDRRHLVMLEAPPDVGESG